ncbi:MAG: response regulator [Candidatus Abyssobacteria bacterium SURF_17]|uniref:Response regulator n=1 Tax=Candidatus Abyssobacteria bacterium SURF_17 TaxID=2093361 RepID=A0A419F3H7_9BACT|nr:MAG: response regulator [Candidatus Abyssubacteria bacterium SURF_17]
MEEKTIQVLLVDDEERIRSTATTLFKKRGFNVVTASTGAEAIEKIKKNGFDVVVLDVKMPDMDGNEVLHKIKKLKPALEVILLTGYGSPDSALAGMRQGAFAYLTKPCDIDLLTLKIREAFFKGKGMADVDRRVRDLMVPLTSFSSVRMDWTVAEAIEVLLGHKTIVTATVEEEPVEVVIGTKTIITTTVDEGIHRCVLVRDKSDKVMGVLSFTDFLQGLESTYMRLVEERPSVVDRAGADAQNHSGIFTKMVRDLGRKPVRELMADKPPTIDADATLLEAANRLLSLNVRRLLVMHGDKVMGVIREKDIMFEMAKIIR